MSEYNCQEVKSSRESELNRQCSNVDCKIWNANSQKKIPTDHKADGDNCLLRHSRLSFIWVKIKSFIIE